MKKYLEHIKNKPTHARRQHAMQVASVCTAFIFVAWLATLGVRLASNAGHTADNSDQNAQQTQLANIVAGTYAPQTNTLQVATTSDYTNGTSGQ